MLHMERRFRNMLIIIIIIIAIQTQHNTMTDIESM